MAAHVVTTVPESFRPQYEFIDCKALAERWCLPESWVRDQVRSRSSDPIPHVRFGKYVRFRWGAPEMEEWALRRMSRPNSGKTHRKEKVQ